MARVKKAPVDIVSQCLKPLDSNKRIVTYIITRCTKQRTLNKIYVCIVVKYRKQMYLIEVWGEFGGIPTVMYSDFDKVKLQELLDDKAKKGYRLVTDTDIALERDTYHVLAGYLSWYAREFLRFPLEEEMLLPI